MKTYAIYDKDDYPIIIGNIFFCAEKLGTTERSIYDMLLETVKNEKEKAKQSKLATMNMPLNRVYIVGNDDEKLETYLMDHGKWRFA